MFYSKNGNSLKIAVPEFSIFSQVSVLVACHLSKIYVQSDLCFRLFQYRGFTREFIFPRKILLLGVFRKIASNKHVDLRKIENFVTSKCYSEDISKDKGKKANFRKSCKNF